MRITIPGQAGRRLAVAAYRPGAPAGAGRHYVWSADAWAATFSAPDCLWPLAPAEPSGPYAALLTADVSDAVAAGAPCGAVLCCFALDDSGEPAELLDCDPLCPA